MLNVTLLLAIQLGLQLSHYKFDAFHICKSLIVNFGDGDERAKARWLISLLEEAVVGGLDNEEVAKSRNADYGEGHEKDKNNVPLIQPLVQHEEQA